jgi:hypothetical protein
MEVSDHLHSPAALTLEKEPAVPIKYEARQCIRASLGVLERRKKATKPVGNRTTDRLAHGSPIRGPPDCIMRPAATFVNCVYNVRQAIYLET